ncbi:MAG: DUF952 domain-containing protein [Candidatus Eremiobacteraeota bacterium]|nr:DUF952 domain-containing protein [Candidatus Eremiobacteraeota bacterium]
MSKLFHIVARSDWEASLPSGSYSAASLTSEGFIHFSYAHQWRLTLQRYYRNHSDLVLLHIDPAALPQEPRVENGFPHLYAPLPVAAVTQVQSLTPLRDLTVALHRGIAPSAESLREVAADLVVLPELPWHRWCPAQPERDPQDEDLGRAEDQAEHARQSGKWLLGGSLLGRRNTALLYSPQGELKLRYEKMHLPQEPGFWEANHYDPGQQGPRVCDDLGFPLGVQLCSDIQRPFGAMFLRAQGAAAILLPRATERGTYKTWLPVMQAMARLSGCYLLSVNRPDLDEPPIGGPSVVIGPDGEVLAESSEPWLSYTLKHEAIVKARAEYPGYLDVPHSLYAQAWSGLG